MLPPILVLSGFFQLIRIVNADELPVIRHADGDIFTVEGSCNVACVELSSGTGSPYTRSSTTSSSTGISISNGTCICQCNPALPVFREDLHICVSDIHECSVTGFVNNPGIVEKVPYVFLPQRGQIIYPQAEIRFERVITPVCGIAGAQQLGKSGWLELRNLSNAESPFRLFRDEGRTFLQWVGETGLKDAAEGKVVIVRLVCRDAAPNSDTPGVFVPCVAFRVAGSPSKSNVREVTFAAAGHNSQGLSVLEYIAIGISSAVLAVIYVASVFLYLNSRKARSKQAEEPEIAITGGRDGAGLVKNNPLLVASRHFESDTSNGLSEDDLGDDLAQSDGEQGFENQVTSAIIHPYCMYMEYQEGPFGTGSIIGERIPEEDVRIVETNENTQQQDSPVLPGAQRRKLYFNPAYFDRQLLLAPPPAAIEFLIKIREVISIAKHKMDAKKFVPTLTGIPEEENTSERCSSTTNKQRSGSVQGSVARSRKSQRCTGCPGCTGSPSKNLPMLPDNSRPMIGESRVRAWLEDVKPPERRWKDAEDHRRNFQENARTFARSLENLKEMARNDFLRSEDANLANKSLASWKDNPPMLRTFQNIARSEILEEDDRNSVSRRSTKSMFEQSNCDRYYRAMKSGPSSLDAQASTDTINAKVRKAIENSFIKQMEENAVLENKSKTSSSNGKQHSMYATNGTVEKENDQTTTSTTHSPPNGPVKRSRKSRAPSAPKKELPDMINELPSAMIPPKRIMDAVIKEMVDVKALEHHPRITNGMDYEVDSLERTNRKINRKTISPNAARQKSPKMKSANHEEKLVNGEMLESANSQMNSRVVESESRMDEDVLRKNYYNLPELLPQKPEGYSLVSEVYVNDGYASPAGSDDSGPEIRYEPENPGHLTIKVQDSPENYVKQDESEYEPDTLDRKPMRLKINGDVIYDRDLSSESYVDSLERPSHIMLRSKCSFRDESDSKNAGGSLHRGYGSLREIYEARLRSNLKDSNLMSSTRSLNGDLDNTMSWKKNKYLTPDIRQAKRQRKPQNQPDVVPLPPTEEIYQQPKPPRRVEYADCANDETNNSACSKNEWDRSQAEAGIPTASDGTPVLENCEQHCVGNSDYQGRLGINERSTPSNSKGREVARRKKSTSNVTRTDPSEPNTSWRANSDPPWKIEFEKRSRRQQAPKSLNQSCSSPSSIEHCKSMGAKSNNAGLSSHRNDCSPNSSSGQMAKRECSLQNTFAGLKKSVPIAKLVKNTNNPAATGKVEDSGYLSSTDSNGSQKNSMKYEFGSVSETDETESICDGASESGAESVGTDSVFFGNFRRLSDVSNFSKSIDSGVDVSMKNPFFKPFTSRNESLPVERSNTHASESESESFITVLPSGNGSRRDSLVL